MKQNCCQILDIVIGVMIYISYHRIKLVNIDRKNKKILSIPSACNLGSITIIGELKSIGTDPRPTIEILYTNYKENYFNYKMMKYTEIEHNKEATQFGEMFTQRIKAIQNMGLDQIELEYKLNQDIDNNNINNDKHTLQIEGEGV